MSKGRVYWITGLSNSGKTTIGTALYYELKKNNNNVVILDGDILKGFTAVSSAEQYSKEGRMIRAKRYQTLAKILADQGIIVIVCTIAMYDSIRKWNRDNIKGYIEIFVDVKEEILKQRDKKGTFRPISKDTEFPVEPDIVLCNDGTTSIRTFIDKIKKLKPREEEDFDRDRLYWNQYYKDIRGGKTKPSQFAQDIIVELEKGKHLLELGCGNGRDSLFFLEHGLRVTALDASNIAVDYLNELTQNDDNALFVCDDFVKCQSLYQLRYDYIYSRFTLHAIDAKQESELLENIKTGLAPGGKLFIEARTTKDELFGKGENVGHNEFIYNNHYRRFIDVQEFVSKLINMGFEIEYVKEDNGFSKTENSDPVLMRIVATVPI